MKEQKVTFKITEDGKETEYEVLLTFESNETGKNYMLFTDNSTDEEGNVKVYASVYEAKEDGTIDESVPLKPVETESEWKIIETIMDELQKETAPSEDEK